MENQPYSAVMGTGTGSSNAPFIQSLLAKSSTVSNYEGYGANGDCIDGCSVPGFSTQPGCSASCYVALTSGSVCFSDLATNGGCIKDSYCPSTTPPPCMTDSNFMTELTNAGLTYSAYCESGCPRHADHFPFIAYSNTNPSNCQASNTCTNIFTGSSVSTSSLISAANSPNPPNVLWYTPIDSNNMHDNTIQSGDAYLQTFLVGSGTVTNPASGSLLATSLFTSGKKVLLLLWWDECGESNGQGYNCSSSNQTPNLFYGANVVKQAYVSSNCCFDEYGVLHLIGTNWNLPGLTNNDKNAPMPTDIYIPPTGTTDFTISATTPADFTSGSTGSSTITVTPSGGFTGPVNLSTSTSPASGLTPNCPASLTITSSSPVTGTCTPSSSTPGTYAVTVTGSGGGNTHATTFTSHVGVFSIGATSPSGTPGNTITSTVTLTSAYNFAGSVSLTDTVPSGLTCQAFSPSSSISLTANGTGTASLGCSSSTASSYSVTVTGTSGSLSRSTTAIFTFGSSLNPPYTLTLQGFDYDGGLEETLTLNGQQLTQLPAVDSPQNAQVYVGFNVDMTSLIVRGTNTLVFTHANWDCATVDTTKDVQVTDGSRNVIFSDLSEHPLSCTQSITYTFTVGASSSQALKGWSGVTIGESDPNPSNPASAVFSGQPASNMELAFSNLTSKGLNAERVIFADPNTASAATVNGTLGPSFYFTPTRLNRTVTLAAHFGLWLILNTHDFCDWVNASYSCTEVEMGYRIVNAEPKSLSFWQYNITQPYHNVYTKIIYEPFNEPLVVGTVKCTPTCPNSNNVTLTYGLAGANPVYIQKSYQDFINMVRNTVGDTSHYVVVENAEWDGDFPTVTDSANMTLYNRHWYYQYAYESPSYQEFDYNGAGGTYEIRSINCSWSVSCAQAYADNATSFEKAAEARFHKVMINTEIGADYGPTAPPDSQATGSCSYSTSSLAFVQRMINDIKATGQIGYTLWTNGAWTGNGVYGCLSTWGTQLTYSSPMITPGKMSGDYGLKLNEVYIFLTGVLALLAVPWVRASRKKNRKSFQNGTAIVSLRNST